MLPVYQLVFADQNILYFLQFKDNSSFISSLKKYNFSSGELKSYDLDSYYVQLKIRGNFIVLNSDSNEWKVFPLNADNFTDKEKIYQFEGVGLG